MHLRESSENKMLSNLNEKRGDVKRSVSLHNTSPFHMMKKSFEIKNNIIIKNSESNGMGQDGDNSPFNTKHLNQDKCNLNLSSSNTRSKESQKETQFNS